MVRANINNHTGMTYKTQMYVDGNTIRKMEVETVSKRRRQVEQTDRNAKRRQAMCNQNKEKKKLLQATRLYTLFLSVISLVTLMTCISFLQQRSIVTNQLKEVAGLETQLATLKNENNAMYDKTMSSIDMEHIKETAINKLGMNYATKDQIIWYDTYGSSYFRQYEDVPDTK